MKSVNDSQEDSLLLIAAEASSCMYAKNFIKAWREKFPKTHFYGVGDREMQSLGMECVGLAEDMAVMGLLEVLKHYPAIKKVGDEIIEKTQKRPPRFALLLDYPGFNLRLAKKLKELNVSVVYYISPQLWAWKKGRVQQVRDYVDDMLVVFPFEVEFYKEHNIEAHFVGHPLVEVVEKEIQDNPEKTEGRPKKVLGLMPGSRRNEIKSIFKTQWKAAQILMEKQDVQVKVLLAPTLNASDFSQFLGPTDQVDFVKDSPTQMIRGCDLILSASGTATLQVALCEKPMVVMYRMNPITAFFAKRLVKSVDAFCIVNLIAGRKVVPEFFQEQASPDHLANELEKLLVVDKARESMVRSLKQVKSLLGEGGATQNVIKYLVSRYG
jgi:lipid-A-disaccharide synthase